MVNINYYSTIYYWFTYDYDASYNASRRREDDDDEEDEESKSCFKIA